MLGIHTALLWVKDHVFASKTQHKFPRKLHQDHRKLIALIFGTFSFSFALQQFSFVNQFPSFLSHFLRSVQESVVDLDIGWTGLRLFCNSSLFQPRHLLGADLASESVHRVDVDVQVCRDSLFFDIRLHVLDSVLGLRQMEVFLKPRDQDD